MQFDEIAAGEEEDFYASFQEDYIVVLFSAPNQFIITRPK
jgi:hypothetical protein